MLDLARIQSIAQSYSVQELFAVLVWQRRFNEFDGKEVIASNHEEYGWKLKHRLWRSSEDRESGRDRDAVVISYWWD